jgi:hypothetical protein
VGGTAGTGEAERDIELVLVTGAGASRAFGAKKRFPLMAEWSQALLDKITAGLPSAHRELLGLENDLDGPQFEQRLGRFLRRVQAFREIEPLLKASLDIFGMPPEMQARLSTGQTVLENWHSTAQFAIGEILARLEETLDELFGDTSDNYVDQDAAAAGYGWLLEALRVSPGTPFVYATTNCDLVAEMALEKLGYLADWGRPPQLMNPSADATLRVEGLLAGLPRYVPVLHLHGRIHWYLGPDGEFHDLATPGYARDQGTPVVMWPDDTKDASSYGATPVIDILWRQLDDALERARMVVVVGHSLNDRYLLEALRAHVPVERVAVAVYAATGEEVESRANVELIERTRRELGEVEIVPMEFGAEPSAVDQLVSLASRVAAGNSPR